MFEDKHRLIIRLKRETYQKHCERFSDFISEISMHINRNDLRLFKSDIVLDEDEYKKTMEKILNRMTKAAAIEVLVDLLIITRGVENDSIRQTD